MSARTGQQAQHPAPLLGLLAGIGGDVVRDDVGRKPSARRGLEERQSRWPQPRSIQGAHGQVAAGRVGLQSLPGHASEDLQGVRPLTGPLAGGCDLARRARLTPLLGQRQQAQRLGPVRLPAQGADGLLEGHAVGLHQRPAQLAKEQQPRAPLTPPAAGAGGARVGDQGAPQALRPKLLQERQGAGPLAAPLAHADQRVVCHGAALELAPPHLLAEAEGAAPVLGR